MPAAARARPQVWMDTLGEWSWPGQHGAAAVAEMLPPPWVPAFPPVAAPHEPAQPLPAAWQRGRRLVIALLLLALLAVSAALVLRPRLAPSVDTAGRTHARTAVPTGRLLPVPALSTVQTDKAGSAILKASYGSIALHHPASYYVYVPPGHATAAAGTRYPVLYLLHGNSQKATAFLEIGLQHELDALIAAHRVPPLIAVMIQGGPGANNWRNVGALHYESYVLEVQEIVDRTLPTIAARGARAIAGLSMGGYGSMELTLDNPYRFGVVESWLGFFNGLEGVVRIDRHAISSLGLHAFVYGGAQDKIANPSEDAPFAALLRSAGAEATAAVYPGEHNLETVAAHLPAMLEFAGAHLQTSAARSPR